MSAGNYGFQGWGFPVAPSGTPGGLTTQVQFNDGGVLAGDSGFVFNKTTKQVTVTAAATTAHLCDANYAGFFIQGSFEALLASATYGGYFQDSGRQVFLCDGTDAVRFAVGGNVSTDTSTGTQIGTSASQKLAFWGAAPVVQPSTTGTSAGHNPGLGTGVTDTDTFTGNLGGTGYTIGDIVLALKQAGILAQ